MRSPLSLLSKIFVVLAGFVGSAASKDWKSAELGTTQHYKYGAFEARIKSAQGSGMVSTFFLWKYGSELPGAQWQEQDFEMWGKNGLVQSQAMTPGAPSDGNRTEHVKIHTLPTKAWERYYTYRMEWTPTKLRFLINGSVVREETDTAEFRKLLNPALAEPMQLRTGLWAGDYSWSGLFDRSFAPQGHFVNWVQVYSYTPGRGPDGGDFTLLWRDDFNTMDWNRWTPSNWTFEYSITDYITANNLIRNGTLVQALTSPATAGTFGAAPDDDGLTPPVIFGPPVDTNPVVVPAVIAAERISDASDATAGMQGDLPCRSRNENVDFGENIDVVGGTCRIGWTEPGEWIEFEIKTDNVLDADIVTRMATEFGEKIYHLEYDGVNVTGPVGVIASGWTTYNSQVLKRVQIQPGRHKLRIVFETDGIDFGSIAVRNHVEEPPRQTLFDLPARLMGADYSAYRDFTPGNRGGAGLLDDVDKAPSKDAGGGLNIGWIDGGEWLEYDVRAAADALYDLTLRLSTGEDGQKVRVELDGNDVAGDLAIPNSGWGTFANVTVPRFQIPAGTHKLRVRFVTGTCDFHYLDLAPSTGVPPTAARNLVGTAGDAKANLSWTASLVAESYKVVRDGATIATVVGNTYEDLGLTNGIEYRYTVVATNQYGDAPASAEVVVLPIAPVPPSAPTDLVASSGDANVLLSWQAAAGVESFKIYRSTDGVAWAVVGTSTTAQYRDVTVLNGSSYSFRVTAIQTGLESTPSVTVDASPRGVAPVAVQGLAATPGDGSVNLSWPAVAGATTYTVLRRIDGGSSAVLATVGTPGYLDQVVVNGTAYTYSIVAGNLWGDAPASVEVVAIPQIVVLVPEVPTAVSAVAGEGSVTIAWTAGANDLTFNIYRAEGAQAAILLGTTASSSYVDLTGSIGTAYQYSVTGVNGGLESARSTQVVATPRGALPEVVSGLAAISANASVSLSWNASAGATQYKILRALGSGTASQVGTSATASFVDGTVANGNSYTYSVVASNQWGDALASTSVVATPDFPAPGVPSDLAAAAGDAKVVLTWTAATNDAGFNVYRAISGGSAVKIASTTAPGYTDATAINGTTYLYSVSGVNGTRESAPTASVSATPRGVVPAAVTGLVAVSGNATVSLTWTASAGATLYKILRAAGAAAATQVGTSATASFTDATVANGVVYTYTVVASNVWGDAAASAGVVASPDFPMPTVPAGLSAAAGDAKVVLTWNASTNAVSYNVYRSTAGGASTKIGNSTTTGFTDATVVNGTTYGYSVSAVNGTKESAVSASVTAKPVAATAKLKAQYKAGTVGATTNGIRPLLQIVNTGTTAVPLSQVTVRYWYTKDGTQSQSYWCDWAQIGSSNVVAAFKSISPSRTNADGYLELSFKTTAGNLAAGASTGEIQSRFSKSDWSNYTQTNDASYDPKSTAYADWTKVTVYVNGVLVWGTEP